VTLRAFREDEFDILFERLRSWMPQAVAGDEARWRAQTEGRILIPAAGPKTVSTSRWISIAGWPVRCRRSGSSSSCRRTWTSSGSSSSNQPTAVAGSVVRCWSSSSPLGRVSGDMAMYAMTRSDYQRAFSDAAEG
jgi:hypothetical protein